LPIALTPNDVRTPQSVMRGRWMPLKKPSKPAAMADGTMAQTAMRT
jgi:hypothetical protein